MKNKKDNSLQLNKNEREDVEQELLKMAMLEKMTDSLRSRAGKIHV